MEVAAATDAAEAAARVETDAEPTSPMRMSAPWPGDSASGTRPHLLAPQRPARAPEAEAPAVVEDAVDADVDAPAAMDVDAPAVTAVDVDVLAATREAAPVDVAATADARLDVARPAAEDAPAAAPAEDT